MQIQLRVKSPATVKAEAFTLAPSLIQVAARPLRVLDFDIENRPLSYLGSDFTTGEVTAISWAWVDRPTEVTVYLLGEVDLSEILAAFVRVYNQADMVTGHFIRGHDLPMVNGALMECGMPALEDKLTQDTKLDKMRTKGVSCSQESLAAMFRLEQSKVHMNQHRWRAANRLTAEGLAFVRERVIGDVQQNIALRQELLSKGYLSNPKVWRSYAAPVETYTK